MSAPRLSLRGFGLRHTGRRAWALRDLELHVEPGQRVLLLGASGSGKSTLLRAMAGLVDPTSEVEGELTVDGRPAADPLARARVGLVLQDPDAHLLLPRVVDDVAFGLRNRSVDPGTARGRAHEALSAVGLHVDDGRRTAALSGGERQRVALAGVLALEPDVMLLDEPTSMLDPQGALDLRRAVHRAVDDGSRTMVVVEHRVDEWRHLVDRVVVISPGGVLADGPPERVLSDASLGQSGVWLRSPLDDGAVRPEAPAAGPALLHTDGATWRFPGAAGDALGPTSTDVHAGRALAVTGRNGTGKSSLLALLGGLRRPRAGQVVAAGPLREGLAEPRPCRWSSRELAGRIGTVFQNPEDAFVTGRVGDEVGVGAGAASETDALLDRLGLAHLRDANPYTLSGGQQRRLSVAAAVAARPCVLVLDEPTFGQDPVTWRVLHDLLAHHCARGGAVVTATHDRWLVEALAHDELRLTGTGTGPPSDPSSARPAGGRS